VSLWGERASAFVIDQAPALVEGRPIVVLFVGGLMKKYQGTAHSLFFICCGFFTHVHSCACLVCAI
jgi:hypothetical protein